MSVSAIGIRILQIHGHRKLGSINTHTESRVYEKPGGTLSRKSKANNRHPPRFSLSDAWPIWQRQNFLSLSSFRCRRNPRGWHFFSRPWPMFVGPSVTENHPGIGFCSRDGRYYCCVRCIIVILTACLCKRRRDTDATDARKICPNCALCRKQTHISIARRCRTLRFIVR